MLEAARKTAVTKEQILEFADSYVGLEKRWIDLPSNLKKIAMDIAVDTLMTDGGDLLGLAGEVDAQAIDNPFARFLQERNGKLVENSQRRHQYLLTKHPYDKAVEKGNKQLRIAIASRKTAIEFAKGLELKPEDYPQILLNEDFQSTNDLSWQIVRDFQ